MGKLDTTSTVTLVINGEQSKTSLRDITSALNAVRAARARMNQEEDPARYQELIDQEKALAEAQRARRDEVVKGTEAQKGFFADFKEGFSEITEMAGRITAGTLIYKGVTGILDGIKSVINGSEEAFNESAKSQAQLEAGLRSTMGIAGETKKALNDLAKAEMDKTAIDDDVINKGEEMLLTFSNIRGEIYEKSIPVITDMTSALNQGEVTMDSMQQTSILVGKALQDPITGMTALRKVGVSLDQSQRDNIKTLVESNRLQDAQAIILKELTKEFGGNAKAVADSEAGPMMKFNTRIGNIQEAIGAWIVTGKSLAVDVLNPFLGWVEKMVDTPLSETLHEDQKSLLGLRVELESTNTTAERRNKIIEDLKEQYPGYLSQVDSDKVKNSELLPILEKINQAFVLRIAYQSRAEKLDKAIKEEADAINDTYDNRQKLMLRIGEIQQMIGEDGIKFTIKGNNENEKAAYIHKNLLNAIRDQAKGNAELNNVLASNKYDNMISGLNVYGNALVSSTQKQKENHDEVKKMTEDLTQFKKASGYNDSIPGADLLDTLAQKVKVLKVVMDDTKKGSADYIKMTEAMAKANAELKNGANDKDIAKNVPAIIAQIDPLIAPKSGKTNDQLKAEQAAAEARKKGQADALAMSEAFTQKIIEFNAAVLDDTLDKNDKEIKSTEDKFDKMIFDSKAALVKYKQNKYANDDEVTKHQDEINDLGKKKVDAVNAIRIRQEKDLADKITELRDQSGVTLKTQLEKEMDTINQKFDQLSKDAGDNQDAQNYIYYNRFAALSDAKAKEEQRLQDELKKIRAEGATTDEDKQKEILAKINQHYDQELADLKTKYSEQLQATQEFKDAQDAILNNKKKATAKANADSPEIKAEKEKNKQIRELTLQAAQQASDAVFEISKNKRQAETDAKISDLEKAKDAELDNANLTAGQRSAINEKYRKEEAAIKLKAWEADRNAALAQAVINGALAVVKALPNYFLAAAAGITAAIQIGVIASQEPPEFGKGGIFSGPSHAEGGINVLDSKTKQTIANVEGGEPWLVLSKNTYGNNKMLIDELLYNSQYRNGAPVSVNTQLATRAATGSYANGGVIPGYQPAMHPAQQPTQQNSDELVQEIRLMREHFADFAKKPWEFNYRLLKQYEDKLASIKNEASA